jgi:putative transposase
MPYNPEYHHRQSIRLLDYDYREEGAYFVTVCSYGKECVFGEVVGDEMRPNDSGEIAAACWDEIPVHFPFVDLDAFAVMPNHIHGILVINRNNAKRRE